MSASTNVLITGASRGLGRGLLERYLLKPNHTVIAANRDPSSPSSTSLEQLPKGAGSKLIIVKIDADSETDAAAAVAELKTKHGIEYLDIVIANAGISYIWPAVADVKIADIDAHIRTNVYGLVSVFQATRPLLKESKGTPIFAPMGTTAASIACVFSLSVFLFPSEPVLFSKPSVLDGPLVQLFCLGACLGSRHTLSSQVRTQSQTNIIEKTPPRRNQLPLPNAAYGTSKAAAGWLTKRIAAEEGSWLTCISLVPGLVETDLGKAGIEGLGLTLEAASAYLVDFAVACDGMVSVLGGPLDREVVGGNMVFYNGDVLPW
ncbi:uncharacterized protein B0I36DRAFT_344555 [Microdochium trichocladiopsis]|uniref:NAD(P)-binding protein n=1 Tax=Microdochium trichocladiopsis TaxID=1682393 RepID=A0A9P9BWS7_9PEZI|nr:uncharacterized protein B0I36DRAFT_344555 [Microdochium trichocladiopsis]KAH7040890.1 hypothetical protein B0I36DRAFT_344555 [Microdochium trichocladiopsis]